MVQVDSLVTSVGELADLSQGAVSAAILAKAGKSLQQEISGKLAGNALADWEHIATGSHKLKCQEVYHMHCPFYYLSFDQTQVGNDS